MRTHVLIAVVQLPLVLCATGLASAQGTDVAKDAKVHIGPLALTPTLSLANAGVDTNVFNDPDQAAPKRDFTITVEPKTDVWLRAGRTWITGNLTEDLVYYDKYATERSANSSYKVGWQIPLTRLTMNTAASYLNTRDRPGFEIDARSARTETTIDAGVELRMLSRTLVGVKGRRQRVNFDKTAFFRGQNLQFELNRIRTTEGLTLRHEISSLTSLTLEVAKEQDRFVFDHLRDSDSNIVTGGVKFDPLALLKGSATIGYRDFRLRSPGAPAYRGSIAQVDLTYVARGSTKVSGQVARDVQYSFDVNNLYYVQTGVNGSIAQQVFGPVDVIGRGGWARLDYRATSLVPMAGPDHLDAVRSFGGGIGYHFAGNVRVGFNIDKSLRSSDVVARRYDDVRYGTSVTYGF